MCKIFKYSSVFLIENLLFLHYNTKYVKLFKQILVYSENKQEDINGVLWQVGNVETFNKYLFVVLKLYWLIIMARSWDI